MRFDESFHVRIWPAVLRHRTDVRTR
jgi:hypothetical protein